RRWPTCSSSPRTRSTATSRTSCASWACTRARRRLRRPSASVIREPSSPDGGEPLTLPAEDLRRLGYRVVDLVVAHLEGLRDEPPIRPGERARLEALLREPPPEAPGDVGAALDVLAEQVLASDERFRLTAEAVQAAITADRRAGRTPFCVLATAGTTNTGAVDPLEALADVCARERLWLHVDGAYGAPAALTERGRAVLGGIERADSLSLDPHKWLFQPYEAGCLLVRSPGALERTFAMAPEYLRDVLDEEVNFRDRGPQL